MQRHWIVGSLWIALCASACSTPMENDAGSGSDVVDVTQTDAALDARDGTVADVANDQPDVSTLDAQDVALTPDVMDTMDVVDVVDVSLPEDVPVDTPPADVSTPCTPNPCNNGGTCMVVGNAAMCMCLPGYSGMQCETNINDCAPNPCMNGGTCVDGIASYTCTCRPGFSGARCETNINDCAPNPCMNGGTCIDGVGLYTCSCPPGFSGTRCETNINECMPNPCMNGGTCVDGIGLYTCTCRPGFSGTRCETNINDCAPNPCLNGGTCVDGVASYTCMCPTGTSGTRCECAGGPVSTLDYTNRGTFTAARIDDTGMSVTGSTTINVSMGNGLGIVGGVSNFLIDTAEFIQFAGNAVEIGYFVGAGTNANGNTTVGEATIEAFSLTGTSLGTRAVSGILTINVSALFGNVPISLFRITANADGQRISSITFRPWVCR